MRTIVVGVDQSESSQTVAGWAGRLASRVGAELVAVNAFVGPWSELTQGDWEHLVARREEVLASFWTQAARAEGAAVTSVLREGDPRDVLANVADELLADLVVLGRVGEGGGPGFLHLGSVAEYAVHHWSRPLAVVPSHAGPVEQIVIGVDGSAGSRAAVGWCEQLAPALGAAVVAVYVEESGGERREARQPDAGCRLRELTAPLVDAGVEVETIVQHVLRPPDGLLGVSSAVGADLLVVGLRGVGGFTGLRAGGVALKVLHKASLPLVFVPPVE